MNADDGRLAEVARGRTVSETFLSWHRHFQRSRSRQFAFLSEILTTLRAPRSQHHPVQRLGALVSGGVSVSVRFRPMPRPASSIFHSNTLKFGARLRFGLRLRTYATKVTCNTSITAFQVKTVDRNMTPSSLNDRLDLFQFRVQSFNSSEFLDTFSRRSYDVSKKLAIQLDAWCSLSQNICYPKNIIYFFHNQTSLLIR